MGFLRRKREGDDLSWAESAPPWQIVLIGVALIVIIGVIDTRIEPQLSSAFFYLPPVLFVSRHASLRSSLACALLATLMSLNADLVSGNTKDGDLIPYVNSTLRFGVLLVVVKLVRELRDLNASLDLRVRDRTERLEAEVKERLKLESRIIEARESEQERIGQDLHDGLCQHLVATAFSASLLQRTLEQDGAPVARDASEIVGLINESITQARDLAKGLYPVPLEDEGLETALRSLAAATSKRVGLPCHVDIRSRSSRIDKMVAVHLYRIAQEALNNAVKHSAARSLGIRFHAEGPAFELAVEDDGTGLPRDARSGGGMGLHIMDYRARAIGTDLEVLPGKAGGTLVRCASRPPSDEKEPVL
jgi:signal transduction histidine kinase